MATTIGILAVLFGGLAFLAGAYYVYGHYEVYRLVSETPTTDVRALDSEGVVELKGRVESVAPLEVTIGGADDAVVSGWRVDDWNEAGDTSNWSTVALGVDSGRFDLVDDRGSVLVDPPSTTSGTFTSDDKVLSMGGEGLFVGDCRAEFDRFEVCHQLAPDVTEPRRIRNFVARQPDVDPQTGSITNLIDIGKKHGERRYFEGTIRDGESVYVLGYARARPDATYPLGPDDLVVGPDPAGDVPFVVSNAGEDRLVTQTRRRMALAAVVALAGLAAVGLVVFG